MKEESRVVFLDYLRVFACFLVVLVHFCEAFYLGEEGLNIASRRDAVWVTLLDSAGRAAVPLFVMASAYLLFPVTQPTGEFFRRRLLRVVVPFAVWAAVYNWRFDGSWGQMLFNFPMATGGHLWFVPMLLGLYLLMPLLSPWAEKATEKEVRGWLGLWFFTTFFPYLRRIWSACWGEPSFGAVPYLWGECPWNGFGAFQYVSGFFGYMLLGLWFRKFAGAWPRCRLWCVALPLWLLGYAVVAGGFYFRLPVSSAWPLTAPYAKVVDLEMSWEFCSAGVALTAAGYFLLLHTCNVTGRVHRLLVRPLSEASYGAYLVHILILVPMVAALRPHLPTPGTILVGAGLTFALSSLVSALLRRIPVIGRYLVG